MRFEEQYEDVLQNIEFAIVHVYRDTPSLSDHDVMRMLEALIDHYIAEKIGRPPKKFSLSEKEQVLQKMVKDMCEWRLGRECPFKLEEQKNLMPGESKTLDEIIQCLKKVLNSVKWWSKERGRNGYLDFVSQFIA